jgi:hypothetical protein
MPRLKLHPDTREALLFLGGMAGIIYMLIIGPVHIQLIPVFSGMMLYPPAARGDRAVRERRRSADEDEG